MNRPTVSVVMPVRNCAGTLRAAVDSILRQTWTDFELLLFDDASTDDTLAVARAIPDPRLRIVPATSHAGYVTLLNRGLDAARGEFIARMDGDDLSRSERFEAQLAEFRRDPGLALCGTWARRFRGPDTIGIWRTPVTPDDVACRAFHECPFCHPSVMIRKQSLDAAGLRYDPAHTPAEDYFLWSRLLPTMRGRNVNRVLLDYRLSEKQISQTMAGRKREVWREVLVTQLTRLRLADGAPLDLHCAIFAGDWKQDDGFVERALAWLEKIVHANAAARAFPEPAFARMITGHATNLCRACASSARRGWKLFHASPLARHLPFWHRLHLSFALQCLRPTPGRAS